MGSSIFGSAFAMWDYNRLNKKHRAICEREGIDESQNDKYVDAGNKSPLFRYVLSDVQVPLECELLMSFPQGSLYDMSMT